MSPGRPPLDPVRWERAVEIFERALEVAHDDRDALIRRETSDDPEVGATVRGMLSADAETGALLDEGIDEFAQLATGPRHAASTTLTPGDRVGDFEIIAELGRGGMGIVYAARDRKLGRVAALKLLPARFTMDSAASERLIAEAQAASALDHPNVATIYQIGETHDRRRFIAMARYEGETLRQRISRGRLSPREAFEIATQVASGLAAAHAAGLIHRDVKPENIFITRSGLVKLLDFGIATLAGSPRDGPTTRGTILYMSPEHARQEPADARSDVWSLGVVLYEMLTGTPPFTGATSAEVLARITDPAPVRLPAVARTLPAAAAAILARALEKDPKKRFPDASHFAEQLERVERQWSRPRKVRVALAVAAVLLVSVLSLAQRRENHPNSQHLPELAVLPVTNDPADREATELVSALGDEIVARVVGLGRVRLVRLPRDSAAQSAGRRGLHLLSLTVQSELRGSTLTVSLQQSQPRRTIWSARRAFDRNDLRELGRDVVIGILEALGQPLTERERAVIGSGFPSSAEAYQEYLRANRLIAVRTPAAVESALVMYRRAGSLDSMFAGAFARQSYAYSLLVEWGWKPSRLFPADPLEEGLALANRATKLDSTSAEAWLAQAYILVQRDPRHFAGAIEAFQHAISLDPYSPEAFHQYGQTLTALGRYTEALAAYRRALDLEPDRAMSLVPMAAIQKRLGRLDESLRLLDIAISMAPRVPYARAARSLSRTLSGDLKGARTDAEFALTLDSNYRIPPLAALARAQWLSGDTARARAHIEEAEQSIAIPSAPSPTEAYWISMAEVTAGRIDHAVRLLRSAQPRGGWLWFYFEGKELDDLRKDPRAAAVLSEADPRRKAP
ncbi:MAG TPA: protein kinase [Gemmatimonadaceae bacterium]